MTPWKVKGKIIQKQTIWTKKVLNSSQLSYLNSFIFLSSTNLAMQSTNIKINWIKLEEKDTKQENAWSSTIATTLSSKQLYELASFRDGANGAKVDSKDGLEGGSKGLGDKIKGSQHHWWQRKLMVRLECSWYKASQKGEECEFQWTTYSVFQLLDQMLNSQKHLLGTHGLSFSLFLLPFFFPRHYLWDFKFGLITDLDLFFNCPARLNLLPTFAYDVHNTLECKWVPS